MAASPALALHGVSKHFGGLSVIENVGFEVPAGARMALIGPNGAGKTTLFNLISGVFRVDAGSILVDGAAVEDMPTRLRVRAGVSRSFQNIRLMPHLSVVENVMLGQHTLIKGFGPLLSPLAWQRNSRWRGSPRKACAVRESTSIRIRMSPRCPTACARKSRSCAR